MTHREARNWFNTYKTESWDLCPRDDFKRYEYVFRKHRGKGEFGIQAIWCSSDEIFLEMMEACNSIKEWGEYVIKTDLTRKEPSGQLLMF